MAVVRPPAHASPLEIAHGYSGRDIARIANWAVWRAKCSAFDSWYQREIAWSAIAEALCTLDERPEEKDLYFVGVQAIYTETRSLSRAAGISQSDKPITRFAAYWLAIGRQWHEDDPVTERIAAIQVYDGLDYADQWTLWALTRTEDRAEAAQLLKTTLGAFNKRLAKARKAAVELWFAPEPVPRRIPWHLEGPRKSGGLCGQQKHAMDGENVGFRRSRSGARHRYCRACHAEGKRRRRRAATALAPS
ncbi:hypothetical protein [Streptomyces sp. NPDC127098]|uniref:hypothetical protein n=1 Tax=Streptomyces sp. NPDC127098 TaxID=3347137 RepID=UPI003666F272